MFLLQLNKVGEGWRVTNCGWKDSLGPGLRDHENDACFPTCLVGHQLAIGLGPTERCMRETEPGPTTYLLLTLSKLLSLFFFFYYRKLQNAGHLVRAQGILVQFLV